jgi:hypothetical protein
MVGRYRCAQLADESSVDRLRKMGAVLDCDPSRNNSDSRVRNIALTDESCRLRSWEDGCHIENEW